MRDGASFWGQGPLHVQLYVAQLYKSNKTTEKSFFLGACLDGYVFDPQLTGSWELELRKARFSLVDDERLRLRGWSFAKSPITDKHRTQGAHFGNCAETFGLLKFLSHGYPKKCSL